VWFGVDASGLPERVAAHLSSFPAVPDDFATHLSSMMLGAVAGPIIAPQQDGDAKGAVPSTNVESDAPDTASRAMSAVGNPAATVPSTNWALRWVRGGIHGQPCSQSHQIPQLGPGELSVQGAMTLLQYLAQGSALGLPVVADAVDRCLRDDDLRVSAHRRDSGSLMQLWL
jgi:hypothetical protein